jgi:parallel beta-helix repeat protein
MQKHLLNNKSLAVGFLTVLFLSLMISTVPAQAWSWGSWSWGTHTVWHVYDGQSIQDAVGAANSGDTIMVHAGTYGWFYVDRSLKLIAVDRGNTIIEEDVMVGADNVTISGFTIKTADYGIMVLSGSNNKIIGNNIEECGTGILVYDPASNNKIIGNKVENCEWGIMLIDSDSNRVYFNKASNNFGGHGIYVQGDDNKIYVNNALGNKGFGIYVQGDDNKIYFNKALGNGPKDLNNVGTNVWKYNRYETSSGLP